MKKMNNYILMFLFVFSLFSLTSKVNADEIATENKFTIGPFIEDWTYGEESKHPNAETLFNTDIDFDYMDSNNIYDELPDMPNAGDWILIAKADENLVETYDFHIKKAPSYLDKAIDLTKKYDGTPVVINDNDISVTGTSKLPQVNIYNTDNDELLNEFPYMPGNYTLNIKADSDENFESIEVNVNFTIKKLTVKDLDIPNDINISAGELLSDVELPVGWEWVNPDSVLCSADFIAKYKVDTEIYDIDSLSSDNYFYTLVTVNKSKLENGWKSEPDLDDCYYGDKTPNYEYVPFYGTVNYSFYNEVGDKLSGFPKNAGYYTLIASVEETNDYYGIIEEYEFEILPMSINEDFDAILDNVSGDPVVTYKDKQLKEGRDYIISSDLFEDDSDDNILWIEFIGNYSGAIGIELDTLTSTAANTTNYDDSSVEQLEIIDSVEVEDIEFDKDIEVEEDIELLEDEYMISDNSDVNEAKKSSNASIPLSSSLLLLGFMLLEKKNSKKRVK